MKTIEQTKLENVIELGDLAEVAVYNRETEKNDKVIGKVVKIIRSYSTIEYIDEDTQEVCQDIKTDYGYCFAIENQCEKYHNSSFVWNKTKNMWVVEDSDCGCGLLKYR